MRHLLPLLFITVTLMSPLSAQNDDAGPSDADIEHLDWLLGTWKGKLGEKIYIERWYAEPDGRIHGVGNYVNGTDSTLAEVLTIQPIGDKLVYLVYPIGQLPAMFLFTELDTEHFLVENPEHDFPHTIGYRMETRDRIVATVKGNGKKFTVPFERVAD